MCTLCTVLQRNEVLYNETEENRHATVRDDVTVAAAGIPALKGEKTTQESQGARVVHCG